MNGRNGIGEFAAYIKTEARKHATPMLPLLDFGEIGEGGTLTVYSFPARAYAPGQWGYLDTAAYLDPLTTTADATVTTHGEHAHDVVRPPEMAPASEWAPGTVVAVWWLFSYSRPFVAGRVAG